MLIYLKKFYASLRSYSIQIKEKLFRPSNIHYKNIPIVINNRNRLTSLVKLVESLENRGYFNIHILDNDSSYEPLIKYYKKCPYDIYYLKKNYGYLALWRSGIYRKFYRNYYVYTDSDVVPIEECPSNFLDTLQSKMIEDKSIMKIGLSLRISDLPDHFAQKLDVVNWESQFWQKPTDDGFFIANVDTTFALYRPFMTGGASRQKILRARPPLEAYHLPWYNNSKKLSDEEIFYIKNSESTTHWTSRVF